MATVLIAALATNAFAEGKATDNGYPYSQVPFTAVKITPSTFWGDRIKAARETKPIQQFHQGGIHLDAS